MTSKTKIIITSKKNLADRISNNLKKQKQRISLTKTQTEAVISELLAETKKSLLKGEEVRLQGYFTLKTDIRKARIAMNLQTGKKMKVLTKRVPKCKFSVGLKEEISKVK